MPSSDEGTREVRRQIWRRYRHERYTGLGERYGITGPRTYSMHGITGPRTYSMYGRWAEWMREGEEWFVNGCTNDTSDV